MTNDDLQLLLDNLRIEIGLQGDITKVILKPDEAREYDTIKARLDVDGRKFSLDPSSLRLTIDSTDCSTPEQN
ncbi:hypothetical protein K0038_02222 [Pseudomonas syringae]|uniref:hypothetical protein n=1 Tax=Pseudomonas syringae TaxID=317 RepID=UPI001CA9B443|nr:hypothetical protein [Pseudomonas syringae]MCI3945183.1 hypothetical protein [Pseudomonas syringae]